ncbi:glycoside hydrolase family 3 protein [Aminivibrio sp.]|jgi:beta-N-acetylhexosaminidase|uniref:glycoside hydrolase family 3 protein n=1 Tax=Aminivibrio sp. TaxID=1872489 RepID=UPI001A64086B|nr:glycoside hydrolase family 3 protein [Aminivibrio sp.]MBL3538454.1 glycoside hydrolase family 3 protein [Aminivibrio sp.]
MTGNRNILLLLLMFFLLLSGIRHTGAGERTGSLSLEEKVGQIMMCYFEGPGLSTNLERLIGDLKIGGVILYSSRGNIVSTEQVAGLSRRLQSFASSSGAWPLLIGIDQEGGLIQRITEGVTRFPGNMALGAANDEKLAAEAAGVIARELSALGINMNFAPVADVNNNPFNPVIGVRSFGSSPELVSRLSGAMASAFAKEGVIPSAKHFPGHGNTETDSHSGLPLISSTREELEKTEFPPFRTLVKSGVPVVMTAHVLVPALDPERPATLSPSILGMLRKEMGFSGVIITDSMGMGALKKGRTIAEAAIEAFNSGADILLFGADKGYEEQEHFVIFETILEACRRGTIPAQRLDEAVRRIFELKTEAGLFREVKETRNARVPDPEGELVADRTAAESVTLVRSWKKAAEKIGIRGKIPLVWPEEQKAAAEILVDACPFFSLFTIPMNPETEDIRLLSGKLGGQKVIFAADYDCWKNERWLELLRSLGQDKLFLLSARTPYSLLSLPGVKGFFALYSDIPSTMKALGQILNGNSPPRGKLPVALPGLYPMGWGEEEFQPPAP